MSFIYFKIIYLQELLNEVGFFQIGPTSLHVDNISAIQIAANPAFHEYTKHIKVDCHSIYKAFDAFLKN